MKNVFEIDFLNLNSKKSGDAICLRYCNIGGTFVHVVDGGHKNSGSIIVNHIKNVYKVDSIENLIVSHNHSDHTGGLIEVLNNIKVKNLWMNRPWKIARYLQEHINEYQRKKHKPIGLAKYLERKYSNLKILERAAYSQGTNINFAFQGTIIGPFLVLSPTKSRYLEILLELYNEGFNENLREAGENDLQEKPHSKSWGVENFSEQETTPIENEMSIVQYGVFNNSKILLTADSGKKGLTDAYEFISIFPDNFMKPDVFQVPHHGSRHNVSELILNSWLGDKLPQQSDYTGKRFVAIASASGHSKHHPSLEVIRAMMHRNGEVFTTEYSSIRYCVPARIFCFHPMPFIYPNR